MCDEGCDDGIEAPSGLSIHVSLGHPHGEKPLASMSDVEMQQEFRELEAWIIERGFLKLGLTELGLLKRNIDKERCRAPQSEG